MNKPIHIAFAFALLAAATLASPPAALAVGTTIHVETAADNTTTDALCTLREAIGNANDDAATFPDCEAGVADDEIVFDGNYLITLTSELPVVNTMLAITGSGAQLSIIEADDCNPVTLPGGCTPATYRVLSVESPGDLTLYGVTIRHGDVSAVAGAGGGILNTGSLSLENSTVTGNKASSGGGLYSSGASVQITVSHFENNSAGSGGAVQLDGGALTIQRSTFSDNSATAGDGGGLRIVNDVGASTVGITNSTFTGNGASSRGGGIFDDGQVLTITNSTLAGNTGGAGLYVYDNAGNGPMEVFNSILSDNTGGDCLNNGGVTFTVDAYNQDSDGSCQDATQKSVLEIGLESLEMNDGPTQTMALGPRSSAIDAGDNAVCPDQDQRTRSRPWAYTCDVGAYEFYPCFVDDSAVGADDGTTWADAYDDLQTALGNTACTVVWVAEGIYKPGASESDYFSPDPDVRLFGGFAGTEESITERMPGQDPSVLSGDIDNNDTHTNGVVLDYTGISGNNSDHVLFLDGTSTAIDQGTIIDGFTITAGQADTDTYPHFLGGGMFCNGFEGQCSPLLRNLTFSGNAAVGFVSSNGGAVYNQGASGESSPALTAVTFRGNRADGDGGAVFNSGTGGVSSPSFTNVTFSGNSSGESGAAIQNLANAGGVASPTLQFVTFNGNTADAEGGAIYSYGAGGTSVTTVTNSILWGDSGTSGDEIYNVTASTALSYSVVEGGEASVFDSDEDPFTSNPANLSSSPGLGTLGYHGGYTPVIPFTPYGSSALDLAQGGANCPPTDQRGVTRPHGAGCDRGAYELEHLFVDVPVAGKEWMEPWIEAFYYAGITTGCGNNPLSYCPENQVTRAEMAVFLLRAKHGGAYSPPAAPGVFADVPVPGKEWMEPWITQFFNEGITTGCGGGNYCPENNVTRAEMAVFVLRALNGGGYIPPAATHTFADVPVPGKEWMEPWIDQFAAEGITTGCGGGNYCPENNVTRAEMAVFIDRAYDFYP